MTKRSRVRKAGRSVAGTGSRIFSEPEWAKIGRSLSLRRELQLVRGMFDDRTDFAIADDLGISPHTVHTHCQRSYRKLEVTRPGGADSTRHARVHFAHGLAGQHPDSDLRQTVRWPLPIAQPLICFSADSPVPSTGDFPVNLRGRKLRGSCELSIPNVP